MISSQLKKSLKKTIVSFVLVILVGISDVPIARCDSEPEVSQYSLGLQWAGRYIFRNTFAAQLEWGPLSWIKFYGGLGIPYSRFGALSAVGTKIGFNLGPIYPHLLFGATAQLYKTRTVTDHLGAGINLWLFQKWGLGVEATTSLRTGPANTGIHFGASVAWKF